MPSRRILCCSVVRFSPSRSAAPRLPATPARSSHERIEDGLPLGIVKGATRNWCEALASGIFSCAIGTSNSSSRRKDDCALDEVSQFPNISRPCIVRQSFHGCLGYGSYLSSHAPGKLRHEKVRQQRNILAPFAKRRNLDRKNVEAIEKILAELLLSNHGGKVTMGRGNDPHIDLDRFGAT